nr:MAG TPA: tail protein [Caudoviricetes sp.]
MQINFNTNRLDILPTDESYRYRSIMGEHTLTLYFSLPTYTEIPTGAWCEFANERYTLNQPAKIVKHNSFSFEYTLTMDSEGANLRNYKLRNPNDKTLKFPFTASPRYHIQILVDCLNMIDSGWTLGTTIEAPEKLISYNHNNCLEALDMIAKAFETEYEIIGKTIHLHKVEYFKNNPLPLQYGKGKGFKTGVSRTTEQSRITRLYVQGGDRNIDRSKYGNKELLLPKSQEYVYEGVTFVSDDKGLSIAIKNAQNNGFVNEQSLDLSHIYPKRKGTISAVFEVDKTKHFYDFTDTTIPQALNFWDMRINGEKMLIYFESGMLSGREFEVQKYDHTQKRFQLQPKEEDGTTMPNDIFKPAVGDQYSVYNMQMPNAYICDNATQSGASWEMMKEACKYLYENRADLFTFTGDLDGIWAKKHWVNVGGRLKMGAYIHFSDTEFQRTPVAIRIVGLKEYVNNPYSPQIELSNKVQGQSFATEIRKLQNQEVYFGELNKRTLSETKRSWRNALETIKQIEEAFPEYTKSIIPATIQTMMALVGNKSGQFVFVANKTNPITVPHTLYFDRNNKQLNAGSGWIKHYALGTTDIKPNYSAADYKYWYAPAFVSGRLDDKAKTYYLYIKASKVVETAEFVLSENKIDLEQEAGYYHFLYATVNSEYNGERGIAQLNGFTEITGGQIKTDKITSGNGQQYIELLPNEIRIKANLQITDGNKTEIKQLVNPDLLSLENKLKQYTNDTNSTLETKLKEYTNKGEIYLRGTGLNRQSSPIIQINGQNIVPDNYRGLYLAVIRRSDLQVIFKQNYDTFANDFDDSNKLADYLNGLNSDVLVALVSRDSFTQGDNNGKKFVNALIRCGANDDNSKFVSRMPYAFLGIPNIGKGNGIEVYTSTADDAPYAEIATKIINGTPQGMNSAVNGMLQAEQQARQAAIAAAKTATEAYARAQSELTKAQAIAEANKQAGITITAEQQARILQLQQNLQQAKTFAEQKVNELNVGGRNLILRSKEKRTMNGYTGTFYLFSETVKTNEQYMFSCVAERNGFTVVYFSNEYGGERQYISSEVTGLLNGKSSILITPNREWKGITIFHEVAGVIPIPTSSVELVKLEKGNKPTEWSPAPEDIENKVADIQTDLQNAINNAKALIAIETQNRQQTDTNVSKLVNKTNFLSDTYIEGNTMATGTMILGNSLGVQAGITGVGAANNDVRLWAGSNYTNRANAPFHVLQDGTLHATNANISGHVEAQSGKISGNLELLGVLYSGNWEREIVNGKETIKGENVNGGTYYGGRGIIYRQDDRGIYTAIGGVAGSVTGVTESMNVISRKPLYPKSKYNLSSFTGQILSVPPHPNDEIDVSLGYKNNRAQTIYGDTVSFGANSLFEYVYTGVADSGTIHEWLGVTNIFVFSDVASNFREIYLPNASIVVSILSKFGFENISRKELSLSFEITIVLSYSVGGKRIRLSGIEGGYLLDNDGNRFGGGNGYVDLARGDAIKVRYYSGDYYTMVISRNS